MKKFNVLLIVTVLLVFCQFYNVYGEEGSGTAGTTTGATNNVDVTGNVTSSNDQVMQGQGWGFGEGGEGGMSYSEADATVVSGDITPIAVSEGSNADSVALISTTSISNYKGRTSPISTSLPYLPGWTHGGWGILQAYFANGPSGNKAYERIFYPDKKSDMKDLKGVINSIPYDGPIEAIGGLLNGLFAALGGPDKFHHGRGFEIANSVERKRRPKGNPLLVLIDANIGRDILTESGYIYVGRISMEGTSERNWDQVYKATIAEALPWDVDLLIISGGMKGITVGTTTALPTAAGAYSQTNYSLSLLGGRTTGITEGKGEAMLSAECYRWDPQAIQTRAIPQDFYDRIHTNASTTTQQASATGTPSATTAAVQEITRQEVPAIPEDEITTTKRPGIEISQELYDMAGFGTQQVDYMNVK